MRPQREPAANNRQVYMVTSAARDIGFALKGRGFSRAVRGRKRIGFSR